MGAQSGGKSGDRGALAGLAPIGTAQDGGAALSAGSVAEFMLETRRWREAILPGDLFGEPAWDVLLALYLAQERRRDLHQAEVIQLARVPKTTAGRVFDRLEEVGLIRRKPGRDVRKRYVALTDDGKRRMTRLLTTLSKEMQTRQG